MSNGNKHVSTDQAVVTPRNYVAVGNLRIAAPLYRLVRDEIAPGTGLDTDAVWLSFSRIVSDLAPKNQALLAVRDNLGRQLDQWNTRHAGGPLNLQEYKDFLVKIGYLVPEGPAFQITTTPVDREISSIAGPQLVVPVDNARYALNAANARWGSLYDALYGTDAIPRDKQANASSAYDPARGARVVARVKSFLDECVPLREGQHADIAAYKLSEGESPTALICTLSNGRETRLADDAAFVGYNLVKNTLSVILLCHNDLHIEIQVDPHHPIGKADPAGVKDVLLESAISTIQDCEDSVAAVDADDKVRVYRNWLGLMKGTLAATFEKNGRQITRHLNPDRDYLSPQGTTISLPGRSLLLVRNVGIHMFTDAVVTADGKHIPEGFLDALITAFAAIHDRNRSRNSRHGNLYVVKPKLHGPDEVASTVALFVRIETTLKLPARTIKLGIMDEERRTTVNLKACIRAAKDRVIFINTGFLDRTGDEIHTSMTLGAVLPKPQIKNCPWMLAYEDWNVDIGIECGLPGRAQIGKGMWAAPDEMASMLATKDEHPKAGANTAWVPSPTAATLHAMHYHQVKVSDVQKRLTTRARAKLNDILTPPLLGARALSDQEIQTELDNNAQGILGYVARWIGQGVGCSKVPDVRDIGLMEDRATLRISSQHIANWLYHGIVDEARIVAAFKKMAAVVDRQNSDDRNYHAMAPQFDSIEFTTALDLALKGTTTPNGYTEPILHSQRREAKQRG